MKCQVCESEIQKNGKYCPECGIKIEESKLAYEGYSIERIRQPWIEKGGENFYKNFKSVEQLGALPYSKVKLIRPTLKDFVNIHFSNIKMISLLSVQPKCISELCDIYRLLGYYSADYAFRNTKLSRIVDIISKTGLFWKLIANKEVQKTLYAGWEKNNEAIIEIETIDEKQGRVTIGIEEEQMFYLKVEEPLNFVDLNILGGNLEAVCNKKVIGEEKRENGKKYFIYQLHSNQERIEYPIPQHTKEDYEKLVDDLVDYIVNKKPSGRVKLEDKVHISGEQCDAYFIIKASEGHRILEKYAGVKCGKKIAGKAKLSGFDESMEYARELFSYNKLGILHKPESRDDRVILTMDESIYSSGVSNIHLRLCYFTAGLLEGLIKESTNEQWRVDETKCLADGDKRCEFTCRIR